MCSVSHRIGNWRKPPNATRLIWRSVRAVCEAVILILKKVPRGPQNDRLIDQLTGCATSVGANYCEADERHSRKDFHHIVGRCKKEAKESKFFLRMLATAEPSIADEARPLYREANELGCTVFASMYRKTV